MPGCNYFREPLKPGPIIEAACWSEKRRSKVREKYRRRGFSVRFRNHHGKVGY